MSLRPRSALCAAAILAALPALCGAVLVGSARSALRSGVLPSQEAAALLKTGSRGGESEEVQEESDELLAESEEESDDAQVVMSAAISNDAFHRLSKHKASHWEILKDFMNKTFADIGYDAPHGKVGGPFIEFRFPKAGCTWPSYRLDAAPPGGAAAESPGGAAAAPPGGAAPALPVPALPVPALPAPALPAPALPWPDLPSPPAAPALPWPDLPWPDLPLPFLPTKLEKLQQALKEQATATARVNETEEYLEAKIDEYQQIMRTYTSTLSKAEKEVQRTEPAARKWHERLMERMKDPFGDSSYTLESLIKNSRAANDKYYKAKNKRDAWEKMPEQFEGAIKDLQAEFDDAVKNKELKDAEVLQAQINYAKEKNKPVAMSASHSPASPLLLPRLPLSPNVSASRRSPLSPSARVKGLQSWCDVNWGSCAAKTKVMAVLGYKWNAGYAIYVPIDTKALESEVGIGGWFPTIPGTKDEKSTRSKWMVGFWHQHILGIDGVKGPMTLIFGKDQSQYDKDSKEWYPLKSNSPEIELMWRHTGKFQLGKPSSEQKNWANTHLLFYTESAESPDGRRMFFELNGTPDFSGTGNHEIGMETRSVVKNIWTDWLADKCKGEKDAQNKE